MSWPVFLAALAGVVIFGGSAIATKVAVSGIDAIDVSITRTLIGGLVALPLALALRIGLPGSRPQIVLLLVSGFCGFIAFPLLFTFGVSHTTANHATMILAILPVLTGAIALSWDRQKPHANWWLGCAIAFTGELLLLYDPAASKGEASSSPSLRGDLLVWISTLFASLGYVAGARLQRSGYSARGTTFWGVGLFALLLLPLAPFVLDFSGLANAGLYAWSGLLYQAIGVTVVAYILWYWALGTGGIARVGLFQFLQPVSGVILAWLILAEGISLIFVLASSIIMVGVILAFRAK
jgi:drug/metabolite transporter (DMT)-like permease